MVNQASVVFVNLSKAARVDKKQEDIKTVKQRRHRLRRVDNAILEKSFLIDSSWSKA